MGSFDPSYSGCARRIAAQGLSVMPTSTAPPQLSPAATHRQIFEARYRPLSPDERAHAGATASDPELSALCFDPVPGVIRSILSNPNTGLVHARLIAAHHANPLGLQIVAARLTYMRDQEVRRLLLRNIHTPESVVRNMFGSRSLLDIFRFTHNHDVPDRHRETARGALRRRFTTSPPEERTQLIVVTEGRALAALPGLALDGASTGMLMLRGPMPVLLVENLARWPGTPSKLITHLLKQPAVGQNPSLKHILLRHPHYTAR
jgi:hypothetical protein